MIEQRGTYESETVHEKQPGGRQKGRNKQELENEINAWLDQNPTIKVVDIKQSPMAAFGFAALYMSVWYESDT